MPVITLLNLSDQHLNCDGPHLKLFLANRRQLDPPHGGKFDVVEPDQGHILRYPEPLFKDRLIDSQCHVIIGGKDGSGHLCHFKKLFCLLITRLL